MLRTFFSELANRHPDTFSVCRSKPSAVFGFPLLFAKFRPFTSQTIG
jgi:hypothetical protein